MKKTLYKTKYKENTILSKVYQSTGIEKYFTMDFYQTVNVSIVYRARVAFCLSTLEALVCLADSSWGSGAQKVAMELGPPGYCRSVRYKTMVFLALLWPGLLWKPGFSVIC